MSKSKLVGGDTRLWCPGLGEQTREVEVGIQKSSTGKIRYLNLGELRGLEMEILTCHHILPLPPALEFLNKSHQDCKDKQLNDGRGKPLGRGAKILF